MKRFAVIQYSSGIQVYGNDPDSGRGIMCEKLPQKETEPHSEEFEETQNVYFCDTERDAQAMCVFLMQRFPHHTYMTVESKRVYMREPGPISTAQFTDKGLLPV